MIGTISSAHVRHRQDFIDEMRDIDLFSGKMYNLDVTSLFTNVPLDYVLQNLKLRYENGTSDCPLPIGEFLDLIRLCVESTVFTFNGTAYKQKSGVAMGSPLSPILANICMKFLEVEILNNCPVHFKPKLWVRYVDDVFILFQFGERVFDELSQYVNSHLQSIQFTFERELNNTLLFLDVSVFHNPNSLKFEFMVYRKPTSAELYIHFYS